MTTGAHIIKTVFPKGNVLFSALEVASSGMPEPAPKETPVIIAPTVAPKTGDNMMIMLAVMMLAVIVLYKKTIKN